MSSHRERPLGGPPAPPTELIRTRRDRFVRYALIVWAGLGPGILAIIGDNDAGGDIAYAVTGIKFGISLFIPLILCLGLITYTVQEMSMRLSAASSQGYAGLVFNRWGKRWGLYHILTLLTENLLTLLTEFIGMTAGLMMIGLPMAASDGVALSLLLALLFVSGYWSKERLVLLLSALNLVFFVVCAMTHPNLSAAVRVLATWKIPVIAPLTVVAWYVIAAVGNSLAPWMIFFQGGATLDKGSGADSIRMGRIDTAIGAVAQVTMAAAIIITGAALSGTLTHIAAAGPIQIISAMSARFGPWPGYLFGFGLFDAGLLAAITISLSSSWTIADAFHWHGSLNHTVRRAPGFYLVYIGSLLAAASLLLIPHLPLNFLSVVAQIVGGVLMAPVLIFLVILTGDTRLMGEHKNGRWAQRWNWTIVGGLIVMTVLGLTSIFR